MNGDEMLPFIALSAFAAPCAELAAAMATGDPGSTLYCPDTMTRSPGERPLSTTERPSIDLETLILRSSALLSALTAKA